MTRQQIRCLIGICSFGGLILLMPFLAENFKPETSYNWGRLDYLSRPDFLLIVFFSFFWVIALCSVRWKMMIDKPGILANLISLLCFFCLAYLFYKSPLQLPDKLTTILLYLTIVIWVGTDIIDLFLLSKQFPISKTPPEEANQQF